MCCRNWRQFWCLLWKNWLLQKKKVIRTILIALFPIFMTALLVIVRYPKGSSDMISERIHDIVRVEARFTSHWYNQFVILYAPETNLVARIVERATSLMDIEGSSGTRYQIISMPCAKCIILTLVIGEIVAYLSHFLI